MLVLDTNHLTEYDRASIIGERLRQRLAASGDVAVTTIVSAEEQMRGWLARINAKRDVRRQFHAYERLHGRIRFFNDWVLLPWDEDAANLFADLRRTLRRMSTMDLKIACITLAHDATLLTRNTGDFAQVPGLRVENWLD